jgi:diguanylate cyclase (GGDEF)-like protein
VYGGFKGAILWGLLLLSSSLSAQQFSTSQLESKLNTVPENQRGPILSQLAQAYCLQDPHKAIIYGQQALALLQKSPDPSSEVTALSETGLAYLMVDEYQKAFEYVENARQLAEENKDNTGLSLALNNLGILYGRLGDSKKALDYFNGALELRTNLKSKSGIASTLNSVGDIFRDRGESEKALEVSKQSLQLWQETGDKAGEAIGLKNVGDAYLNLGELNLAEENLTEALHLNEQLQNKNGIVWNLLSLSTLKYKRGKYVEAEELATKALNQATALPGKEMLRQAYQVLAAAQEGAGDYSGSVSSHKKFKEINDSISTDERARRLALLDDSYDLQKRNFEIYKLKKDQAIMDLKLEKQDFRQKAFLGMGILLAILGFVIHRKRVEAAHITEKLSFSDTLTGLPNRRFVTMTIHHDVANSLRKHQDAARTGTSAQYADLIFSVVNLDDFKKIRDQHGRAEADEFLKQIGHLLQGGCRATDTIVRWSEEEFLIISRFCNREAASLIAERFRKLIASAPFMIGEELLHCTCSIGFAAYPFVSSNPDSFDWEQVIAFASRSLDASKRTGRDAWVGLLTTQNGKLKDFQSGSFANLRKWIDQGELSVVTSLPASTIQW